MGKPDPNCEHCKGKGFISYTSTKGGEPYASGTIKCTCAMTPEEKREDDEHNRDYERVC